jgi:hypothetical protein
MSGTMRAVTAMALIALVGLAASPARAVVAGPATMLPFDITGSYVSLPDPPPSPDPFADSSFEFSVQLPTTMDVTFSSGASDTYTGTGAVSGTYTNDGVSEAFTDALVTFTEGQDAGSIGSQSGGAGAGKVVFSTIEFTIANLLTPGDSFDITAVLPAPEWSLSNPGGDGTLSPDTGNWAITGTATYDAAQSSQVGDPDFTGELDVPEPASLVVLASGVGLLIGFRQRRVSRA